MGMPRMMLISALENWFSAYTPDTRISAHTIPRTVATASAHTNTSTVISAPFASSGRYSARSLRESTAGQVMMGQRLYPAAAGAYTPDMTLEHANPSLKSAVRTLNYRPPNLLKLLGVLAVSMFVAGSVAAAAPTPHIDENDLLTLGFKVLVPTTKAQQDWVKRLAPGEIRPMQRTGKKFFIVPDASRKQIYVGGPNEYAAYRQAHPDSKLAGQEGAK